MIRFSMIIMAAMLLFNTSCEKENECDPEYEMTWIDSIQAPSTGEFSEGVPIEVFFTVKNGCGEFHQFHEETGENGHPVISLEAIYEGCVCTEALESRQVTYEFVPDSTGTHTLLFLSGEDEYITAEIETE